MLHKNAVESPALEILAQVSQLTGFESFALGGGTNLALRYGHRLSVDLDFFTSHAFDTAVVYKTISSEFGDAELLFEQNQTMMFIIRGVKVDFILYPFEWSQPFEQAEGIRMISAEDIIPMKLQAISNRFSKKDFWDIERLLESYPLEKMLAVFKAKFPPVDTGYIIHSLTNFDIAGGEEDPISLVSKTWDEVKVNITKAVVNYTRAFF